MRIPFFDPFDRQDIKIVQERLDDISTNDLFEAYGHATMALKSAKSDIDRGVILCFIDGILDLYLEDQEHGKHARS